MQEKVSVIIPAYNAEVFIDRSIQSVLNQTYRNMEVIIVNDGSTDRTREICEKYSKEDKRIVLINQENSGVSKARNAGLDNLTGEYVMFVDADDWIDSDYVERLYSAKDDNDIIVSSFTDDYDKDVPVRNYNKALNKTLKKDEIAREFAKDCIDNKLYTYIIWGKLYKKDVIGSIRFAPQAYSEDALFIRTVVKNSTGISFLDCTGYHYRISGHGVTSNEKRDFEMVYGALNMTYQFNRNYEGVIEDSRYRTRLDAMIYDLTRAFMTRYIKSESSALSKETRMMVKDAYKIGKGKTISLKKRLQIRMIRVLYCFKYYTRKA